MSGTATIRKVIDSYMETFETGLPGTVSAVNSDGTVDAVPSVRNSLANLQQECGGGEIPPMRSIPVLWPGTAKAVVKFELAEGDPVWLVSGSRDQSGWAAGDWADAADDPFRAPSFGGNDLNSLVAIPVRRERHGKTAPKTTVTIGRDGKVTVECREMSIDAENVKVSGELEVGKSVKAGGEVTANAGTLPVNLSTHTHMTAVGPSDPGKG